MGVFQLYKYRNYGNIYAVGNISTRQKVYEVQSFYDLIPAYKIEDNYFCIDLFVNEKIKKCLILSLNQISGVLKSINNKSNNSNILMQILIMFDISSKLLFKLNSQFNKYR